MQLDASQRSSSENVLQMQPIEQVRSSQKLHTKVFTPSLLDSYVQINASLLAEIKIAENDLNETYSKWQQISILFKTFEKMLMSPNLKDLFHQNIFPKGLYGFYLEMLKELGRCQENFTQFCLIEIQSKINTECAKWQGSFKEPSDDQDILEIYLNTVQKTLNNAYENLERKKKHSEEIVATIKEIAKEIQASKDSIELKLRSLSIYSINYEPYSRKMAHPGSELENFFTTVDNHHVTFTHAELALISIPQAILACLKWKCDFKVKSPQQLHEFFQTEIAPLLTNYDNENKDLIKKLQEIVNWAQSILASKKQDLKIKADQAVNLISPEDRSTQEEISKQIAAYAFYLCELVSFLYKDAKQIIEESKKLDEQNEKANPSLQPAREVSKVALHPPLAIVYWNLWTKSQETHFKKKDLLKDISLGSLDGAPTFSSLEAEYGTFEFYTLNRWTCLKKEEIEDVKKEVEEKEEKNQYDFWIIFNDTYKSPLNLLIKKIIQNFNQAVYLTGIFQTLNQCLYSTDPFLTKNNRRVLDFKEFRKSVDSLNQSQSTIKNEMKTVLNYLQDTIKGLTFPKAILNEPSISNEASNRITELSKAKKEMEEIVKFIKRYNDQTEKMMEDIKVFQEKNKSLELTHRYSKLYHKLFPEVGEKEPMPSTVSIRNTLKNFLPKEITPSTLQKVTQFIAESNLESLKIMQNDVQANEEKQIKKFQIIFPLGFSKLIHFEMQLQQLLANLNVLIKDAEWLLYEQDRYLDYRNDVRENDWEALQTRYNSKNISGAILEYRKKHEQISSAVKNHIIILKQKLGKNYDQQVRLKLRTELNTKFLIQQMSYAVDLFEWVSHKITVDWALITSACKNAKYVIDCLRNQQDNTGYLGLFGNTKYLSDPLTIEIAQMK